MKNIFDEIIVYLRVKDFINIEDRGTECWTEDDEEILADYLKDSIEVETEDGKVEVYFRLNDKVDWIAKDYLKYDSNIYEHFIITLREEKKDPHEEALKEFLDTKVARDFYGVDYEVDLKKLQDLLWEKEPQIISDLMAWGKYDTPVQENLSKFLAEYQELLERR